VALVAIPGIIIVVVSFGVGYWKMKSVIDSVGDVNNKTGPKRASDVVNRMKRTLRDIRFGALSMCISMTAGILSLLAYLVLGGFDALHPDRSDPSTLVAVEFGWVAFSAAILFAAVYIAVTVGRKVKTTIAIASGDFSKEKETLASHKVSIRVVSAGSDKLATTIPAMPSNQL